MDGSLFIHYFLYCLAIQKPRLNASERSHWKSPRQEFVDICDKIHFDVDDLCVFVADVNELAKLLQCEVYFLHTPMLCYLFYLSAFGDFDFAVRLITGSCFVEAALFVAFINNENAKVSLAAHAPYSRLNSILAKGQRLPL